MHEIRRMRPLLGTYVEVAARAPGVGEAQRAVARGFEAVDAVHRRLSFHDTDSELTKLNRSRGEAVELHPGSVRLLRLARAMMLASGGLFNMTVGGELVRRGALPDHGGPPSLDIGRADDIELHGRTARLRRPVRITLDGVAKGFAIDLAVQAMRRTGARGGWVNAGGDLRAFGDAVVPVCRREPGCPPTPLGALRDAAIATSQSGGEGAAWDADLPSLIVGLAGQAPAAGLFSVLARNAWRADALTKVACLAADAVREPLLRRLGGVLVLPGAMMLEAAA
jgi:FAD:protein FMN transferase